MLRKFSCSSGVRFAVCGLATSVAACAANPAPNAPPSSPSTAARIANVLAGDRTPSVLPMSGDPNGLWWDDPSQTLYIADDDGNRVLCWTAEHGVQVVQQLSGITPQDDGLGQLVRMMNGTLLVTRFGHGGAGGVAFLPRNGEPSLIPGLDVKRRRIGLTVTADGRVFDAWFDESESGGRSGAVAELALNGTETDEISGLKKPVGVLAIGDQLFVSDQDLGEVLRAPLENLSRRDVLARVSEPDLLAAGPHGTVLTGSAGGTLVEIDVSGKTSLVASGFHRVRGVAYDAAHQRAFVADHAREKGVSAVRVVTLSEDTKVNALLE